MTDDEMPRLIPPIGEGKDKPCICGHRFSDHVAETDEAVISAPCGIIDCACLAFCFVVED